MFNFIKVQRYNCFRNIVILVLMSFFIYGCAQVKSPDRFSTAEEVFPLESIINGPFGAPPDAVKVGVFAASYDDVFQSVTVGVTQALLNIEEIHEDKGVILATRSLSIKNAIGGQQGQRATRMFSYAIFLKELESEITEVTVIAKIQDSCFRTSGEEWVLLSILSFGIIAPTALLGYPMEISACKKSSTIRWAVGQGNSIQELGQLMTFIRSNLFAAGLL